MLGMFTSEEKKKLNRKLENLKDELDNSKYYQDRASEENRKLTKKLSVIEEKHADEVETLKTRVKVLESLNHDSMKLQQERIQIDYEKSVFKVESDNLKNYQDKLNEMVNEKEKARDEGYKGGYSDGLADGLRKIHEITAEDRKQAMQVAALAASSHTPDAANVVAESIRENMMALPEGKKVKK